MTEYKDKWCQEAYDRGFKEGREFEKEEVKHNLMMKLKDEGIVKPLKDSILRNERLSSQEQQELCAWIECAIDFGENLDECAKELEEANKANEWHYPSKGEFPKNEKDLLMSKTLLLITKMKGSDCLSLAIGEYNFSTQEFVYQHIVGLTEVYAWKEIVLPELPKESE